VKTGVLTNYKPVDCSNVYVISNADGRTDSHTYLDFDSIGRDWHYAGSLVYVEEHGIMTNSDNLHYSETLSKWVLRTEAVYSDELRDFIYKDDSLNDQNLVNERKDFIEKSRIYNQIRIEELSKKMSNMDLQELLSISDYFGRR
jgi:hypothetical protein